jgi:hypothetical protein
VFSSPTATIEVVGNTENMSSEKAGVGGSTPSLATIYFVNEINGLGQTTNYHHTDRTHFGYSFTD